ncbi:MAG: MFS transporter, partial [Clostridia bacterium]
LNAIAGEFSLTSGQVGLVPSLFAVPYAVGQLIIGILADRADSRKLMWIGLLGSVSANFGFSCATKYSLLLVIWCLNGCFQSMVWTPMLKILSEEFSGGGRDKALFRMSATLILGYLLAWSLSSMLTNAFGWRCAFCASGALTALLTFVSARLLPSQKQEEVRAASYSTDEKAKPRATVVHLIFATELWLLLLCGVINGYIRDGVMTWAPKMIMDTQHINLTSATGVMLIIPIVSFAGIQLGKVAYTLLDRRVEKAITCLFVLCALAATLLGTLYRLNALSCALLLGICSALTYGINPLLTSVAPMAYAGMGRVATAAGLMDAAIYLGSALAGMLTGVLHDNLDWTAVFASWGIAALCAVTLGCIMWKIRKYRAYTA